MTPVYHSCERCGHLHKESGPEPISEAPDSVLDDILAFTFSMAILLLVLLAVYALVSMVGR